MTNVHTAQANIGGSLAELSELDYQLRINMYPNVPADKMCRRNFSDKDSNSLTQSIIRWLTIKGHYYFRMDRSPLFPFSKVGKYLPFENSDDNAIHCIINGVGHSIVISKSADNRSLYTLTTFDEFMAWYKKVSGV